MCEAVAHRCELVLDLWRHCRVHSPGDQPISFQPTHGERQHPLRDTGYGAWQLPKTAYALGQFDHDQDRSLVPDPVEHLADPAVLVLVPTADDGFGGHLRVPH